MENTLIGPSVPSGRKLGSMAERYFLTPVRTVYVLVSPCPLVYVTLANLPLVARMMARTVAACLTSWMVMVFGSFRLGLLLASITGVYKISADQRKRLVKRLRKIEKAREALVGDSEAVCMRSAILSLGRVYAPIHGAFTRLVRGSAALLHGSGACVGE